MMRLPSRCFLRILPPFPPLLLFPPATHRSSLAEPNSLQHCQSSSAVATSIDILQIVFTFDVPTPFLFSFFPFLFPSILALPSCEAVNIVCATEEWRASGRGKSSQHARCSLGCVHGKARIRLRLRVRRSNPTTIAETIQAVVAVAHVVVCCAWLVLRDFNPKLSIANREAIQARRCVLSRGRGVNCHESKPLVSVNRDIGDIQTVELVKNKCLEVLQRDVRGKIPNKD